ncbi:hypothetical protein ABOM_005525 [Aspergillus bombycis]|uniref:Cytochrome P450 n=1 Tax=Aspergillus bombycis TaxID=109264 RepID=A0A1F8A210_9EURO|nr:hypothetical protein ABOM_005525 [Aspergillus bombycis]OGM45751.1 hypothetical protein ABOM_005525 [Aspergillus bombycis]
MPLNLSQDTRSWEFCHESMTASPTGNYSYYLGRDCVVGLSGPQGRKTFFESRDLDLDQGVGLFFPISSAVERASDQSAETHGSHLKTALRTALLRTEALESVPTATLACTNSIWKHIAAQDLIDPFQELSWLYAQSSLAALGMEKVAQSPGLLRKVVMVVQFVAQATAPAITSWLLMGLATDAHWMARVRLEVDQVLIKYRKKGQSVEQVLQTLDLHVWEHEFPLLDACFLETIRTRGVLLPVRKNISQTDTPIGDTGEVIPVGAYVTYHADEEHMNPEIYPDPQRWDLGRFLSDRAEHRKELMGYIGFGVGRRACRKLMSPRNGPSSNTGMHVYSGTKIGENPKFHVRGEVYRDV